MIKLGFAIGIISIWFVWVEHGHTFPVFDAAGTEVNVAGTEVSTYRHHKRVLTQQETELANAARAHIAKVLEKNLIRFFTAVTLEDERTARQFFQQQQEVEEEEEDAAETATFNPNTLPQVSALLGAIFSGNLNLTNVVDRAFFLVPDTVRKQVTGLFKLIGGNGIAEPGKGATSAPVAPAFVPHPLDTTTTPATVVTNITEAKKGNVEADLGQQATTTGHVSEVADAAVFGSVFEMKGTAPPGGVKKPIMESEPVVPIAERVARDDVFSDDELSKAEETVVEQAKLVEPLVRDKEPRYFLGTLQKMFRSDSLNFTEIIRVMPDLFKGARQAFVLLEQLGEIGDDL